MTSTPCFYLVGIVPDDMSSLEIHSNNILTTERKKKPKIANTLSLLLARGRIIPAKTQQCWYPAGEGGRASPTGGGVIIIILRSLRRSPPHVDWYIGLLNRGVLISGRQQVERFTSYRTTTTNRSSDWRSPSFLFFLLFLLHECSWLPQNVFLTPFRY